MNARPGIDAVVVTYNSGDTIRACVAPLLDLVDVRVTVVDNASDDGTLEAVCGLAVRAVRSGRNAGFGAGCNLGARTGDAPLLLLLNPDATIAPADLTRLVAVLDAEPDVGLVGPRLLDGDGKLIPSLRRLQRPSSVWSEALYLHRLAPDARWSSEIETRQDRYDAVAYPEWISGAAMLVRREAFDAIGGFDEQFFLYCEDQDLCARLRTAGWRIRYEPEATVSHVGGHSAPRTTLLGVLAESRIHFARKHSGRVSASVQRLGVAVGALTHLMVGLRRPGHAAGHRRALTATLRGTSA